MSSSRPNRARDGSSLHAATRTRYAPSRACPPGPWTWRTVVPRRPVELSPERHPRGEALVAADGTWVLWAQEGYAPLEVVNPAARALLAAAGQLPRLRARIRTREQSQAQALRSLQQELLEARRWAWWYCHRGREQSADCAPPAGETPAWLTRATPPAAQAE